MNVASQCWTILLKKLHWLVVWLLVVEALYKNQHRRFVESDAPPVSLQGGASAVGRGQLHQVYYMYQNQSTPEYVSTIFKEHLSGAGRN